MSIFIIRWSLEKFVFRSHRLWRFQMAAQLKMNESSFWCLTYLTLIDYTDDIPNEMNLI